MLLANKNAVVYGGGGAVGGTVARAFAREGARVFLAGRTLATLGRVARDIVSAGGAAEAASVDAFDEQALDAHARGVVEQAGSIDVAFNAVAVGNVQGTPLVEMSLADFTEPLSITTPHFLIAKAVAPHMVKQSSGVIMTLVAHVTRMGIGGVGGFGAGCGALEGLSRQLAAELGPQGVRVVWLRSAGSPDTPGLDEVMREAASKAGITRDELEAQWADGIALRRMPRLAEVGSTAALLASDHASAITAAGANMTCGAIVD
jgi:NAD(P)-dependent dehydrogenase (short-subunit alcohol dehydrogenase family)